MFVENMKRLITVGVFEACSLFKHAARQCA